MTGRLPLSGAGLQRRDGRDGRDDRGSGTVLVLGLIGVVALLMVVVMALGGAAVARHRAEAAADLAALAAADAGCDRAAAVAVADGGVMAACGSLQDGSYIVRVTVPLTLAARLLPASARPSAVGVARAGLRENWRAGPIPVQGPQSGG